MTGGTTSTRGHIITRRTASGARGTGTGGTIHGSTAVTTHGATLGTTEAIGADGTTRSATGDSGDGTHGTIPDIGEATHGIRTMRDGTAVSALFGAAVTSMAVRDTDTEAISPARHGTAHDMRRRATDAYSRIPAGPRYEEAPVRAAASAAEPSVRAAPHVQALLPQNHPEAILR